MSEAVEETYDSVAPDCPSCHVALNGHAEPVDVFTARQDEIHHIVDCRNCETRLDLVIYHEHAAMVEIWVTTED